MRQHAKEFKNEIQKNGRQLDSKIIIKGSELVLGAEDLFSVTPVTNSTLLKSVMKEVDFESKKQIGIGQEINVKSGVKVNGEYEYIDYGNYFVYKSEYRAETDTYSHICYDKMLKTMIDYTPLDITYPINLREYINAIATKCGLEFADKNSAFANYNTSINEDHFSNGNYTFRDVLDYIAQLVGGWLCINDNDELEIRYPELAKNYDKVSGENVSFISNVEDEINTIIVDGKSTQATSTQSANLCPPFTDSRWTFTNGVSVTNDGYLSIPANSGARAVINIPWNKSRTCYFKDIIVSGGNAHYAGEYFDENGKLLSSNGKATVDKGANYQDGTMWGGNNQYGDALTQTTNIKFTIQFSNYTPNPYVIKDLIISENDINYIPFTPNMPSPDYPSEIESVGYENLLNNIATTQTVNGITYTKNDDDSITLNGTATSASYIQISNLIPLHGTFTLSGGESIGSNVYMRGLDVDDNYAVRFNTQPNKTSTATVNSNRFVFYLYVSSNTTVNNVTVYPQLTKGSQVHSYIPYGKYGIEVKNTGKNLLENRGVSNISNGITFTVNDDKTILVNGNNDGTANSSFIINNYSLKAGTYILNGCPSGGSSTTYRLAIQKTSGWSVLALDTGSGSKQFTIDEATNIQVAIFIQKRQTISNLLFKPMIRLSSIIDDTYEPYKSVSSLFVLDQPLRSLPNGVKDELVIENGRAKIIKNVGKYNITGNEAWALSGTESQPYINFGNYVDNCKYPATTTELPNLLSNYYLQIARNNLYDGRITLSLGKALIIYDTVHNTSLANFKEWLKSAGVVVYYQLATPIEIDLGEVTTLSTFEGVNNVSLDTNIQTNMSLTYTTEFEELDKHFLKDVNVSFSKKYGAVNSVVFSRGNGSDNIYRKDNASINKNGLTEIKIADNPFLEGDDRENFIQSLFDKINGLEFYIMDVASTGIMYLELGDFYYFNMVEEKPSLKSGLVKSGMRKAQGSSGGKFLCLLMNDEIKITQGLEESIYSDEPEITETNYKTASITDTSIKNAIIQTNKNSAEILLKVNSDEVVSAINLSPEKIKISSSKLDIDAIATFTNSKLAEAGSTVINGANITTGSINCDRLNGGTINGQAIRGGSISIQTGNYYFNMGTSTSNPNCSGLNVGGYGIKAYSDITATGFAITDSDIGKSESFGIKDYHGHVHYLTFTGGILTKWEYK